jgi:hypothetical protein
MCLANRIGAVDVYLTSHHGLEKSGSSMRCSRVSP